MKHTLDYFVCIFPLLLVFTHTDGVASSERNLREMSADDRDENNFFWAKYNPASPIINAKGLVVSKGEDTNIEQEGCGSGYTCTYDQRIEAYGCAPLTNTSKMVCCSAGQQNKSPEQWCVDCSNPGKPCHLESGQLPFCPANLSLIHISEPTRPY